VRRTPRAAILVTGEEILQGRVQERNAGNLARSLEMRGVHVERVLIVGDGLRAVEDALRELVASGVDLVVVSGGLGPTHDDRTMEAVAGVAGRPLRVDAEAIEMVARGRAGLRAIESITEDTRRAVEEKQAMLPEGATAIPPAGTAPGCVLRYGGAVIVVLPGPPWELAAMWEHAATRDAAVVDVLARGRPGERRVLRLFGVVESEVAQALGAMPAGVLDRTEVGVCARAAEVEVAARGDADAVVVLEASLQAAFGERLYSRDGSTALDLVARGLRARGETLSIAESCTGGLLGSILTSVAGSSEWFVGGAVVYEDSLKERLLGVRHGTLARHGAVSPECAREMAAGARRVTGADWALSVTGIAGPGGGTPEKPVGLVYLGVAGPGELLEAHERRFRGDRERVRGRAAATAIHLLRVALAEAPAAA
jgi:nicotinamide-nucleotide amidase